MQCLLLLGLTLASSVAEVVSLGAIVPFIGILTNPDRVFVSPTISWAVRALDLSTGADLVLPITVAFAFSALAAGGLRVLLLSTSIRLGNAIGADLSIEAYRRTLYQPYRVHVARSSSEIISGITQKVANATAVLVALAAVVTSAVLMSAIMITLLVIDPGIAGASMAAFGTGYALIAWSARRRLARNSQSIPRDQTTVVKNLQEGLGAIRDVLLDGTQELYCETYGRAIRQLQRATGENAFINQSPRFAMETLAMVLVAVLAYSISSRAADVGTALPVLGALGLGAQRLLPLLQQLYGNWAIVAGNQGTIADVLVLLDQPVEAEASDPPPAPMPFQTAIAFDQVSFRYTTAGPLVLDDINLVIRRGARIGLIGTTGSGKSTTLDLLMALLEPTHGAIVVDGVRITSRNRRAWQRAVAHVPQSIYLSDASVAENIAFGIQKDQIDMSRVRLAASQAQLAEFIESGPDQYDTVVGERGIRLSGGQRQRIGIARALYKQATVLIFDEATSALDGATESAVMDAIDSLRNDLTILMVAHRVTTLRLCENIVQLERGRIVAQGSYAYFQERGFQALTRVEA